MGHVHILRDLPSPPEGFSRTVRVYTPDAYDAEPGRRFGVLYMHDGQNVFAHPASATYDTWCANRALEALVGEGRLAPWLVVGVDSGAGRLEEYSPYDEPRAGVRARAGAYGRFLVEHLKPWVDARYRTRPDAAHTAVMGSSLGGLVSLWLGQAHAATFGRVGALSPTVMWGGGALQARWRRVAGQRLYLDAGATEHLEAGGVPLDYGRATRDFWAHLKGLGYDDHELCLVLEPGGEHHERDWQRRLPFALRWLLA